MKELITLDEASTLLGVSRRTINRRIKDGSLTTLTLGPQIVRVRKNDVMNLLTETKR